MVIYIKNIEARIRKIANKSILMVKGKFYEINDTGILIFNSVNGKNNTETIIQLVQNEHSAISKEVIEKDCIEFLKFLLDIDAIK